MFCTHCPKDADDETRTMVNKDDQHRVNGPYPPLYQGGLDGSVNNSDVKYDRMADMKDDLIAGKKARLKKSLSSCSTWVEVKTTEDKNHQ